MAFTFPLDTAELFAERARQFHGWGIPWAVIERVRARVRDAWSETPGGWAFEWVQAAEVAEREGNLSLAAACFGAAKFPCAVTPYRRRAMARQVACYKAAAFRFPCRFERRVLEVSYRETSTPVAVHLFERRGAWPRSSRPIVCLSGGVDTGKMELHRLALVLALLGGFQVVALDMPGTGESAIPLAPDAERIYAGVLDTLRRESRGPVPTAIFGLSFGGHWAAKLALREQVDAAVDLGGPVGAAAPSGAALIGLPNGMSGIVANAMGLESLPTPAEAEELLGRFSLRSRGLLEARRSAPILAVNGGDDAYVPGADLEVFREFPAATVWRIEGTTHCAAERIVPVITAATAWLRVALGGNPSLDRMLLWLASAWLRPR